MNDSLLPSFVSMLLGICLIVLLLPDRLLHLRREHLEHVVTKQIVQGRLTWSDKLQQRLDKHQTGFVVSQYLLLTGCFGGAAYMVSQAVLQIWWLALPTVLTGVICSERLINLRSEKRKQRFEEGNIRAMRIMASSLRTSPSYLHAFEQVAASPFVHKSIAAEYSRVVELLRGQVPLERAMNYFYQRTGSDDIAYLATIVQVQRELGGDMAKTLDQAASAMLRRKQLTRKQRAALSQILAQVNLMTAMPFLFAIALYANNPHHFDPLLESLGGRVAILGAFFSVLAGGELIRYIALKQMRRGG